MWDIKTKRAARGDYKVSDYRVYKKKVAQLKTIKRERELQENVKPRESRKIDGQLSRANAFW
jgi:hypothetical protein